MSHLRIKRPKRDRPPRHPLGNYYPELVRLGQEKAAGKPGVYMPLIYHDDWCRIYRGDVCNCDPEIEWRGDPERN